jgi:hypothetical protein
MRGARERLDAAVKALVFPIPLSCMRGNRSSSLVTWFDDQGRMRMLRWRVS